MSFRSAHSYEENMDGFLKRLSRLGVKFSTEDKDPLSASKERVAVADASKLNNIGINTLGKLDFLKNYCSYRIYLPQPDLSHGLSRP